MIYQVYLTSVTFWTLNRNYIYGIVFKEKSTSNEWRVITKTLEKSGRNRISNNSRIFTKVVIFQPQQTYVVSKTKFQGAKLFPVRSSFYNLNALAYA